MMMIMMMAMMMMMKMIIMQENDNHAGNLWNKGSGTLGADWGKDSKGKRTRWNCHLDEHDEHGEQCSLNIQQWCFSGDGKGESWDSWSSKGARIGEGWGEDNAGDGDDDGNCVAYGGYDGDNDLMTEKVLALVHWWWWQGWENDIIVALKVASLQEERRGLQKEVKTVSGIFWGRGCVCVCVWRVGE